MRTFSENYVAFPAGVSYFLDVGAHGYDNGAMDLNNGTYVSGGIGKACRLIGDSSKDLSAAIVVEREFTLVQLLVFMLFRRCSQVVAVSQGSTRLREAHRDDQG